MAKAIMRIAKLKGGSVGASDAHTDRTRKTPNADAEKTPENIYILGEKGEKLTETIKNELAERNIKKRKNAVECVEFFFGASPEYFTDEIKKLEFAKQTKEFMDEFSEKTGIKFVKAVMHVDETTPHIVAYAIPFDLNGKLNARATFGGDRNRLSELQDEFAEKMAPIGLERGIKGSRAEHQDIQKYYGKVDLLDDALQKVNEVSSENQLVKNAFQSHLDNSQDIQLQALAGTIYQNYQQTSQGIAIIDDSNKIKAIITDDNTAFSPNGNQISDGSSVKLLAITEQKNIQDALKLIEETFGSTQMSQSARAFGDELATQSQETRNNELSNQSPMSKKKPDFDVALAEIQAQKDEEREEIYEETEIKETEIEVEKQKEIEELLEI